MNNSIEFIPVEQHDLVLDVLGEAFASHPMVPPDPKRKPKHWGAKLMMRALSSAPDAQILTIRRDGQPACVAFIHDGAYEPSRLTSIGMLWQMCRVVGIRGVIRFLPVLSEKHAGDDRRLELLILGTHSDYQGQGLGRVMIRKVIQHAKDKTYAAVTLEVAKGTPALAFYQSEGFIIEKEISVGENTLCLMRCEINIEK